MARIKNSITAGRVKLARRAKRIERSVRRNSRTKTLLLIAATLMAAKNVDNRSNIVIPVFAIKNATKNPVRRHVVKYKKVRKDTTKNTVYMVGRTPTALEVMAYADSAGASHPRELTAQLVLESGWFRSYIAKTRNNIGGIGGPGHYKYFTNWKQCVDYVISMQKRAGLKPGQNYFNWLNNASYHGSNKATYNTLLINIMRKIK